MISDKMLQLGLCFLTFMINYNELLLFKIIDSIYIYFLTTVQDILLRMYKKKARNLAKQQNFVVYFLGKRCI